jgi:hemerythrin
MKHMLYIVWNEENNLGIPIIDEQHRGIVATINSFHYLIQQGRGRDALQPTLSILEQYTRIHFRTEEALMEQAGFPGFADHVALHEDLKKRTEAIARETTSDQEPEIALAFLKDWWLGHINSEDRQYATHVRTSLNL